MPVVDKLKEMVGITPTYTTDEREAVRTKARKAATSAWFNLVLDHHVQIEEAFAAVKSAGSGAARAQAQKDLDTILTGHSNAEEAILYPVMNLETSSSSAKHAYAEQATAKMEMVALDMIADKMSEDYDMKLEEIRQAVVHHMVEEEQEFFPELQDAADATENRKMTDKYTAEVSRYLEKAGA